MTEQAYPLSSGTACRRFFEIRYGSSLALSRIAIRDRSHSRCPTSIAKLTRRYGDQSDVRGVNFGFRLARTYSGNGGKTVSDVRLPATSSNEPQEREFDSPAEDPETPPPITVSIDKPALAAAIKAIMTAEQLVLGDPVVNSVGMVLVPIPPGKFQMGSPASEVGRYDDEIQHRVQITKPFYLSVHEVTQEQYEDVMDENPSYFSALGKGKSYVSEIETSQFPVEQVSWKDAVEFCRKLSKEEEGVIYRLPTEAEWEYACRAGTTKAYSSGPGTSELDAIAWYGDNSGKAVINSASIWETDKDNYFTQLLDNGCRPHIVGGKSPNAWGLFDMHGNVWEWCQDWYAPHGSENVVIDPAGPASGEDRVLRG